MTDLTRCGSLRTSMPLTKAAPPSGGRMPSSISTVVVLPAPFGPRMPNTSPGATENETPATASRSP